MRNEGSLTRQLLTASVGFVLATCVPAAQAPTSLPARSTGNDEPVDPGVSVSGRVVNLHPEVEPTQPREIVLSAGAAYVGSLGPRSRTPIRPDGTFEFKGVRPGRYRLSPNPGGMYLRTDVEVAAHDIQDVRVPVSVLIPVTIRATMDDGSALPAPPVRRIQVQVRSGPGRSSTMSALNDEGTHRGSVVPGTSYIFLRPPAGYFVKSLRTGDVDLRRAALNPPAASPPIEVAAVISRTPPADLSNVKVSGRVSGNHPGVEVRLVDASDFFSRRRALKRTTTGPDGTFVFPDVTPGPYSLDLPPARDVLTGIVALGEDVEGLEVAVPAGVIFSGLLRGVYDASGRAVSMSVGAAGISIRFSTAATSHVVPVGTRFFWSALPPGSYRVEIEGLPKGFSVRSLSAGSVDLTSRPFVVPATRPPEQIEIALQTK
jgi:hypothetical protein